MIVTELLKANSALSDALNNADKALIDARTSFYNAAESAEYVKAAEALIAARKAVDKFGAVCQQATKF